MKYHEIKILPEYFVPVVTGLKRFELRKNDRNYEVGDAVILKEWDGENYTGYQYTINITYILNYPCYGLERGYCIFGW